MGGTQGTPNFTNRDDDAIDDFKACAEACGFKTSTQRYDGKAPRVNLLGGARVWEWLEQFGLRGCSSYTKFIPDQVLTSSRRVLSAFIGAYWTCDGNIDVRPTKTRGSIYRASCTTVSERLARDTLHALTRLGIRARLRSRTRNTKTAAQPGGIYQFYAVDIASEQDTARLADLPLCERKRDVVKQCRRGFDRVLIEDAVVSLEPVEPAECRCVSVEDDHSLTWDDLATHNCMKSLLVSVMWPAWEWTQSPHTRYLCVSYDQNLSTRDNVRCRRIVESDRYRELFPQVVLADDQNQKTRYDTQEGGWRIGTSVGAGRVTGEHPHRKIIDDPIRVDDARSEVERQRVIDHFDETLSSRGKALHAATVIIMQRLHQHDLSAHVLERHGATYTHICLPMEYEPPQPPTPGTPPVPRMPVTPLGWQDPRTEPGELLWPALFDEATVRELALELREYGAAGQLQQRPVPPGGAQFKRDWFRIVDALPAQGRLKTCRGWDCAATEPKPGTDPDYTVGTKIAHFSDGLYYVEDVIRGRWSPGVVDQTIRQTAALDGPRVRIREEQEGGHSGKNVIASHTRMLAGYDYQGQPATGAKTTRWRPFAVQAEAGNVRLLTGAWNQAWLEELTSVPVAKHDDQADSAALAFEAVALGYRAASVARTREGG